MPSALSRDGKMSVNTSIGSTVLSCKSRLVTSSKADIQCRLMSFRGSRDGPGPPKLQLIASGKVERSLPIKLTSARLRQGVLIPGQRRVFANADTAGGEEADSYPPRSATKVPRPISPRVHPLSASDLNAAVTVVKLTSNSDASRRSVGRRSPGFNWPVRIAWHKAFAICSYRGAPPPAFRLAILLSAAMALALLSCTE